MAVEQDVTMSAPPAHLRHLTPADAAAFRALRLAALISAPDAFCASHAAEAAQPLDWFAARLERSAVFGAFQGDALCGIAGFLINDDNGADGSARRGVLWGMYVTAAAQGQGIGRDLILAVIQHARDHVPVLRLGVIAENMPARRLYQRLGFTEIGTEERVLAETGRAIREVVMSLPLSPDNL